ncbi:inositol monophosphatase family protein [Flavihumibacter fluvii]|uniref:inositol monophosphatase family protein n=1 Tax=Flavihumibacter fluvii TaxID=2838157 RepID=UPI001BDF567D|nr:inositol monophosphatase [Flavihumibacter fluvii]ULQ53186.1 inositol monophosphatase [Flavihumibacter fluvii]
MKDVLIAALKISGKTLLEYFNQPLVTVQKESISSVVTEADLASERNIIRLISEAYPGHNILSEESGYTNNHSDYTWIIDPLDGTSNFAAGIPWFGALIALFKDNIPIMGGAFLPVQDLLYYTETGKGVFRNEEQLPMLPDKDLKDSLFAFCTDYTEDKELLNRGLDYYTHLLKVSRNIRATNCLLDFLYVVEGKFGGVLNLYTRVWDIAATGLMITELGGVMKNTDGQDISFSIGEELITQNFPVIAGTEKIIGSSGILNLK